MKKESHVVDCREGEKCEEICPKCLIGKHPKASRCWDCGGSDFIPQNVLAPGELSGEPLEFSVSEIGENPPLRPRSATIIN